MYREAEAAEIPPCIPADPETLIPASLWASWEVRQAVLHSSPGTVIAIARRARGLRQDQLGEQAGFSQSAISRLESGGNLAYDMRVLRIFQRLLSIPAHLLGLTEEDTGLKPTRPQPGITVLDGALDGHALLIACAPAAFHAGRGRHRAPIDDEVIGQLLVLRRVINDADSWCASSSLLPSVRQLYEFVDRLRPLARDHRRAQILDVAALFAEFSGWLHLQQGDLGGASWWTERAMQQALAAEDPNLVAYCYRRLSMIAEFEDDDDRVIGLARAATREPDTTPQIKAMALQQQAQGHARTGDELAALKALDEAQRLVEGVQPERTPEYRLGNWFRTRHVELQRAAVCVDLGRTAEAQSYYQKLLSNGRPTCRWLLGVHLAKLAYAHATTGEFEQAGIAGSEALALASSSGSVLITRELRRLKPWSRVPSVAGIFHALGN
ncbi:helix-turn-helix transcriptional regulator [Lentzea sp. NPDC005914]|uniref:helix-turn-helix domain-containing protein n=1 Tax=Lentzea sp. NPDC005914 TaxID=3154572 RepID=UPI0034004951